MEPHGESKTWEQLLQKMATKFDDFAPSGSAKQASGQNGYELKGQPIYWPTNSLELHNLINFSFGDCWRKEIQKPFVAAHRIKLLHFGLWSLAEFFDHLTIGILQDTLSTKLIVTSNTKIVEALGIEKSGKLDSGVNLLYRTLTLLCLMARQTRDKAEFIDGWSAKRMNRLLSDLDRKSLSSSIVLAPPDASVLTVFFSEEHLLRSALVRVALHHMVAKDELFGPLRNHVVTFWSWSGLYLSKVIYDFCLADCSDVWKLPGMHDEAVRFVAAFDEYQRVNGDMSPLGNLLELPLVDTVRCIRKFPNLYQAILLKDKALQLTGKYYKKSGANMNTLNDDDTIRAALAAVR